MEGVVLTPLRTATGKVRTLARRVRTARDRVLLPEATSGAEQWQRVPLNAAVNAHLDALAPATLSAAEISGDAYKDKGWAYFDSLDYPAFDLCAPLDGHRTYDVVLCEQVMEHVVDPIAAAANLRDLCNPGGHVIVSTPFLIRVHELPAFGMRDYWRFTPSGLRLLLERAGLQVDEIGHWGNRRVVRGNLDRWPAYRRWHALGDEPDLPVQVWAFARRPAGG